MHLPKYIFLDPWPSWYSWCVTFTDPSLLDGPPGFHTTTVGLLRIISRKNYIFLYLPKDKVVGICEE